MKYKKHYQNLIKKYGTKIKPNEYYSERHHILPKCLGGDDSEDNLVYLSGRAHFVAHLILCKLYPNNPDLLFAIMVMSERNSITSSHYASLKAKYAETQKGRGKIEGKPVITPKGEFPSIYAAAKAHKLSRSRMAKKLRSTSFTCRHYYFKGEQKKTKPRTGHGLHLAKRVMTPIGEFISCREAAKALGVTHSVVARRAKNPNRSDYCYVP